MESVDSFAERAKAFVAATLPRRDEQRPRPTLDNARALQAQIFDAGFAGIAFPKEYGGAGLTLEHQKAWAEAVEDYEPPMLYVSIAMLGVTLLEHGSETLKARHLPRILRGDETWIQLLSEPSGGSDMAGATTRATRDGDTWVINGAKIWSTGAGEADYAMCLARTDWEAPKHKGLSMFAVPLRDPKVTIEPIIPNDGGPAHFFQEFLDDVVLPADHLIGPENEGWSVAHTLLFHERNATAGVGHGFGLGGGRNRGGNASGSGIGDLLRYAQHSGRSSDDVTRARIAEAFVDNLVRAQAGARINEGMRAGAFKGDWGSLLKLGLGLDTLRRCEIGIQAGGADAVIWSDEDPAASEASRWWLSARGISIGGGTNEMQRNIVSERLLGMPREPNNDRDLPFNDVIRRQRG